VLPRGTAGQCVEAACIEIGCGNNIVEIGEACDDGNTVAHDGCSARCDSDERCGNGFVDPSELEACDCGDAAFVGERPPGCAGQPNSDALDAVCTLDCKIRGCGDGQVGPLEDCDGTLALGKTCANAGYYGGTLGCSSFCRYDVTGCVGKCGDDVRNGPAGMPMELCDGTDLGGLECDDVGFYSASGLTCSAACTFDTRQCSGRCGDDLVNGPEACDGAPPSAASCTQVGYDAGQLGCSTGCNAVPEHCRSTRFAREAPGFTSGSAYDVWGIGNEFFAVGSSGRIIHTTGGVWTEMADVGSVHYGVWGASATDVFAVGGTLGPSPVQYGIYHYDGASWSQMTQAPSVGTVLRDVSGVDATNVWAVGDSGTILRNTAGTWTAQSPGFGSTPNLTGVWASRNGAGYVVVMVGAGGTIWRYDGTTWSNQSVAATENFLGVWGTSPAEIYAITSTAVWRFNGTWTKMTTACSTNQTAIGGQPGGGAFIVTEDPVQLDGKICQLAGGRWFLLDTPSSGPLHGISGSASRIYAVGDVSILGGGGANWLSLPTIASPQEYHGVWGFGFGNLFLVGKVNSTEAILGFNGSTWSTQPTPNGSFTLRKVFGGVAWAVAVGTGGRILASNGLIGDTWTSQASFTSNQLNDVWGDAAGAAVYAVGDAGTITTRTAGVWTAQTVTAQNLRSVFGAGNTVFVVGTNGTILRKVDTGAFTAMPSPTTQTLFGVWARSPTDAYAVGSGGAFHYDGTSWKVIPSGAGLQHVWGGAGDVFASSGSAHYQIVGGRVLPIQLEIPAYFVEDIGGTGDVTWFSRDGNATSVLALAGRMFRPASSETACSDFWDDDEDGLPDCADPDCSAAPACASGGGCQPVEDLTCSATMTTVTGSTMDQTNRWPAYGPGCNSAVNEAGPERFFRVRRSTAGTIQIAMSQMSADLDLVVADVAASGACLPETSCKAASQQQSSSGESVSFSAAANTDYIVIVDGRDGESGTFKLDVTCP
jgi:cysteine-rich repeat protein